MVGLFCTVLPAFSQSVFRVMEYNVENLFDCVDDSLKNDEEFLPGSGRGWTTARYWEKLSRLSKVIVAAGHEHVPDLVGLCEVENDRCMKDLTRRSLLKEAGYWYVMTASPDARGVDVALLYQPSTFKKLGVQTIRIPHEKIDGMRATRDILHVTGKVLSQDTLDVFVCHMPSRSGGEQKSEPYRLLTASVLKQTVDSVMAARQNAHIVIMGDFNDYPDNRSIAEVLNAVKPEGTVEPAQLYDLMAGREGGTYRFKGDWGFLDHFIVSGTLLGEKQKGVKTSYEQVKVADFPFLMEEDDRYGGLSPFRTYKGWKYNGGYSDHLPVWMDLLIYEP